MPHSSISIAHLRGKGFLTQLETALRTVPWAGTLRPRELRLDTIHTHRITVAIGVGSAAAAVYPAVFCHPQFLCSRHLSLLLVLSSSCRHALTIDIMAIGSHKPAANCPIQWYEETEDGEGAPRLRLSAVGVDIRTATAVSCHPPRSSLPCILDLWRERVSMFLLGVFLSILQFGRKCKDRLVL